MDNNRRRSAIDLARALLRIILVCGAVLFVCAAVYFLILAIQFGIKL